ncbi:MAG: ribosomal RNA adenine dimethylase, partial [Bacteroidota bacterium]
MNSRWSFFKEAVRNFRSTGAIASSSPALVKRLVAPLPSNRPVTIVELGPGDGCVTRAILTKLHPDSTLTAFEINPAFVEKLTVLEDKRLEVLAVGAERLTDYFAPGS